MDSRHALSRRTALAGAAAFTAAALPVPAAAGRRAAGRVAPPRWALPLPRAELASPVWVHAGLVHLVRGEWLLALDAADGRQRWRAPLGAVEGEFHLAAVGDRLVVSLWHNYGPDHRRRLLAFDRADGRPLWSQELRYRTAALAAAGDRLFLEGNNHVGVRYLQIRDADTGAVLANLDRLGLQGGPGPVGAAAGRLLVDHGGGHPRESLRLLDTATGQTRWEHRAEVRELRAVDLGDAFLAATQGGLLRLHAADGTADWELRTDRGPVEIACHAGVAYLRGGALTAVDVRTGGRLWRRPDLDWPAGLHTTATRLLLAVNDRLHPLDPATGAPTGPALPVDDPRVGTDADSCYAVRDAHLTAWTVA